jgi:hypothetical protein
LVTVIYGNGRIAPFDRSLGVSHLGDDAEAFFQQGDDGTYEGGPKSLSPSTRDTAHEEDDLTTEVTPALLERRDRLQRVVKGVVGTLGACVLVLLPFRLGIAGGASMASAATAVELSTPGAVVAAQPTPPSEVRVAADSNVTPPAPTPTVEAAHSIVTTNHVAPKAVTVRAPFPARHASIHVASGLQHGALRAAPAVNAPLRTTSARRAAVHVPPTASFPD